MDPEEEFFKMCLITFQMQHQRNLEIMKLDYRTLYLEAIDKKLPFSGFIDFIDQQINKILMMQKYKRH